jgi:hypothetical protein
MLASITSRRWGLRRHRHLFGNRPHKRRSFPGNGHDDEVRVFAACEPLSVACAQPDLGFPAAVLDDLGWVFQSQLQVPTDVGGIAIGPGAFNEGATGMRMTGCGDGALTASLPTGMF